MQPYLIDNTIGQRLKAAMQKQGINSVELARRADVKTSFLYDIMNGKSSNPSSVKLARVAEILGMSLAYLSGLSAAEPLNAIHTMPDYVAIPRVSVYASAGDGAVFSQEKNAENYYFRKSWIKDHLGAQLSDLRLLYVQGDSMEPTLYNDDMILIDTGKKHPSPPGIFVVYDGMGLVAKRLEYIKRDDTAMVRIVSDNPRYSPYERTVEETVIVGRIVWFAREI